MRRDRLRLSLEERKTYTENGFLIRPALFDGDETAQRLFDGTLDGIEGQKLRGLLGLSQKDFDSKRRFVRRRLNQHFERNVS